VKESILIKKLGGLSGASLLLRLLKTYQYI